MKFIKILFTTAMLGLFSALPAQALPLISGTIGLSGSMTPQDSSGVTTSLGSAAQLSLFGAFVSQDPTGSFAAPIIGSAVSKFDTVTTSNPLILGGGADPLWEVGGFRFNLLSSTVNTQNDTYINVSGYGVLSHDGYQDTYGSWHLSGNPLGAGFNFSAGSVPAPAALGLIGLGLIGFSLGRRVKKAA